MKRQAGFPPPTPLSRHELFALSPFFRLGSVLLVCARDDY